MITSEFMAYYTYSVENQIKLQKIELLREHENPQYELYLVTDENGNTYKASKNTLNICTEYWNTETERDYTVWHTPREWLQMCINMGM